MKITNIYIKPLPVPSARLVATATIIIDNVFAINDIKILKTDCKYCIAFPKEESAKKLGRETIAPLNSNIRSYIEQAVLQRFYEVQKNSIYNNQKKNIT